MRRLTFKAGLVLALMALTVGVTAVIKAQLAPAHNPLPTYIRGTAYKDGDWKWSEAKTGTVKGKVTFSARRPRQPVVIYLVKLGADGKPGEQGKYDPPGELSVSQKGAKFSPSFAVLVRKQKVKFLNDEKDEISHNVYFLGDIEEDLGIFDKGQSRTHTFDEAGDVSVHCSIHKRMDAKYFITPNPAYAILGMKDTSFEIKNVPAGKYELRTWQKQKRFKDFKSTVEVSDGKTTDITVEMKR
jgi:hypothetical protein